MNTRTHATPILFFACALFASMAAHGELQAGAAAVDITPETFPVSVNGGMLANEAEGAAMPLKARAIVVADDDRRIAIVVADSCMMPRDLLDRAKARAAEATGIPPEHMLIAATHTHSAPAAMGCLGAEPEKAYIPFLEDRLAQAIADADANLAPARVGWASANAADYTAVRRWIRRPDQIADDPFGNPTVRANMHAASNLDDVTGESGPIDPELSLISFTAPDGRPIAVLANFSMHYFGGVQPLHPDYFGLFAEGLQARLAPETPGDHPPFVAMMSHGCSGDIWRRDYRNPDGEPPALAAIEGYAEGLADIAMTALDTIEHQADADIAMEEARLPLEYRVPDRQRLEWARRVVAEMGDRLPENTEEVYAREQIMLHEWQSAEVVVQAARIGEIGVAATPTETYALTGLKIKLQSPLPNTMVLDLANGADGYIPPPEQHVLGGYNTWAARTAGLEVQAEPKISEAALRLLERVADKPRRPHEPSMGPAAKAILALDPMAYWRLDDLAGPWAADRSGHHRDAIYEPGVVFFLPGPRSASFAGDGGHSRAAHFAGGRVHARVPDLGAEYSVSLWFWNGMPAGTREMTGWLFSRGRNHGLDSQGVHLGLDRDGRLLLSTDSGSAVGAAAIERWTWNHVVLVHGRSRIRVYLNGDAEPGLTVSLSTPIPADLGDLFVGGHGNNAFGFEGRIAEIAVFGRALTPGEARILSAPPGG